MIFSSRPEQYRFITVLFFIIVHSVHTGCRRHADATNALFSPAFSTDKTYARTSRRRALRVAVRLDRVPLYDAFDSDDIANDIDRLYRYVNLTGCVDSMRRFWIIWSSRIVVNLTHRFSLCAETCTGTYDEHICSAIIHSRVIL